MSTWLRARLVLDRVAAAVLLVLTAPLLLLLIALVRRQDDGPALITVERVGRQGTPFRMWKVRSMRASNADGTAGGPALTGARDERITPIGRRLRSYHLDELPQLWNVLRGEMLLLGPRPEAAEFVDAADPCWQAVLVAPPGIAGPTQLVVGAWERECLDRGPDFYRREILPVKLAADAWYLRRANPLLDLFVCGSLFGRFRDHEGVRLRRRVGAEVEPVGVMLTRRAEAARGATGSATIDAPQTAAR